MLPGHKVHADESSGRVPKVGMVDLGRILFIEMLEDLESEIDDFRDAAVVHGLRG
jgi:hypothetical protein